MRRISYPVDVFFCLFAVIAAATHCRFAQAQTGEEVLVAAASSLRPVLPEIVAAFEAETGHSARLVFGSSGNLASQILQGAPFEVFLSADQSYADVVVDHGLAEGEGIDYATGRLVLYIPFASPLVADETLEDLRSSISDGRLVRFSIANPSHAPYGILAKEILQDADIWNEIYPFLVFGENVAQAAQFAASGSAQGALVAGSIGSDPKMRSAGISVPISATSHAVLSQRMVLIAGASKTARELHRYLLGSRAAQIFARFGFAPPLVTSVKPTDD